VEFLDRRIRLLLDQLPQAIKIDLDDRSPASRPRRDFSVFSATLHDPTHPGDADLEKSGDLFGLKPSITSDNDPISKILRIRCAHPCGS
jgi:hypothetical protein